MQPSLSPYSQPYDEAAVRRIWALSERLLKEVQISPSFAAWRVQFRLTGYQQPGAPLGFETVIEVPDRVTGQHTCVCFTEPIPPSLVYMRGMQDDDSLYRELARIFFRGWLAVVRHEAMESFSLNGELYCDPHQETFYG